MSFGQGLAQFVQRILPKLLVFVSLLSIYQSISGASKTYSLADLFPVESTPGDVHKAIKEKASFNVNDTLLGNHDPFFWFLHPLFLILSVGVTSVCWIFLSLLVRLLTRVTIAINWRGFSLAHVVNR